MKTTPILLLLLFVLPTVSEAQMQWYQNQDAGTPPPSGTFGNCVKKFTAHSFVACYQWNSENELYTWKISKSHVNGTEQRSILLSGTWASVEMRVGRYNSLYVLLRSFPIGSSAEFTVYKLDSNLVIQRQQTISLPGSFSIINVNTFDTDDDGYLYLAGDGSYVMGPESHPASFIMKADRNLNRRWLQVDSTETSFTQVAVDPSGLVTVIEDYYLTYPDIRIRRYNARGELMNVQSFAPDPGRFNLFAKLDNGGNLLLYGGKLIGDTAQGMYICKLSRSNGRVIYNRTLFPTAGFQLQDLAQDENGRIFTLVTKYENSGEQVSVVARLLSQNGALSWQQELPFSSDSVVLTKLVTGSSNRIYAVGFRRNTEYFSKGIAYRFLKTGQRDGSFNGPDSINSQRNHALVDGMLDNDDQLISVGNTNDFDPNTYNSTYFRAFAVRFGQQHPHHGCEDRNGAAADAIVARQEVTNEQTAATAFGIYPNPAVNEIVVSGLDATHASEIVVFNLQGKMVLRQRATGSNSRITTSALPAGMYTLVMRSTGKNEKRASFVIQR